METEKTDVVIVGTGASGLFAALHVPRDKKVLMITKDDVENSDSFLAQGGICVLHDESDYDSFMEDTLRAGHYENRRESVDIMIRSSRRIIDELVGYGVDFARKLTVPSIIPAKAATPGRGFSFIKILRARKLPAVSWPPFGNCPT